MNWINFPRLLNSIPSSSSKIRNISIMFGFNYMEANPNFLFVTAVAYSANETITMPLCVERGEICPWNGLTTTSTLWSKGFQITLLTKWLSIALMKRVLSESAITSRTTETFWMPSCVQCSEAGLKLVKQTSNKQKEERRKYDEKNDIHQRPLRSTNWPGRKNSGKTAKGHIFVKLGRIQFVLFLKRVQYGTPSRTKT